MSFAEAERARVRAHLQGALAALRDAPTDHLDDTRRARRAVLAAHLAAYIAAGRFPRNTTGLPFTPVFVDDLGTRCAVASMLDATGGAALVHAVADTDNLARVHTLAALPALRDWLDAQGLTVDEAARIQPAYQARDVVDWRPAVAVVTEAAFGRSEATGAHLALGVGARVGVRRRVHSQSVSGYGALRRRGAAGRVHAYGHRGRRGGASARAARAVGARGRHLGRAMVSARGACGGARP